LRGRGDQASELPCVRPGVDREQPASRLAVLPTRGLPANLSARTDDFSATAEGSAPLQRTRREPRKAQNPARLMHSARPWSL
jgi:hypothetical protein